MYLDDCSKFWTVNKILRAEPGQMVRVPIRILCKGKSTLQPAIIATNGKLFVYFVYFIYFD